MGWIPATGDATDATRTGNRQPGGGPQVRKIFCDKAFCCTKKQKGTDRCSLNRSIRTSSEPAAGSLNLACFSLGTIHSVEHEATNYHRISGVTD